MIRSFMPVKPPEKFLTSRVVRQAPLIKKDQTTLNAEAHARQVYIDTMLATQHSLTIADMREVYDISYYVAASDLRKYAQAAPNNVNTYIKNRVTVWQPTQNFTPLFPDEVKHD